MPRKGARHAREPGKLRGSTDEADTGVRGCHFRSVRIGVANGKRWLSLKRRLGLGSDEELAVYLLDLADSVARQDEKQSRTEEWRNQNGEGKVEAIKSESAVEDAVSAVENTTVESAADGHGNSRKAAPFADPPSVPSADTAVENVPPEATDDDKVHTRHSSRSKRHRNKAKHRKDKRKKRKHPRDGKSDAVGKTPEQADGIFPDAGKNAAKNAVNEKENVCGGMITNDVDKSKLGIETFGIVTDEFEATKTEYIDNLGFVENVNSAVNGAGYNADNSSSEQGKGVPEDGKNCKSHFAELSAVTPVANNESPSDSVNKERSVELKENEGGRITERHSGSRECNNTNAVASDMDLGKEDERKKKKRRRPRHENTDNEEMGLNSSEDVQDESAHKHRKKKHKHTGEHKNKKHHDVRKAPQDGIIVNREEMQESSAENEPQNSATEKPQSEAVDGVMSEPQRLAIKIKLCQDCNSRHLQDACPLNMPQYTISDSISCDEWLERHKENPEVLKAVKSEDPMSEGYSRLTDDTFESDDDSVSAERSKSRPKVQKEEKQLHVDSNRPLYARESLPECLELRMTNSEHGLGVYAKNPVPMYAKLGPLIGRPVREMDIPDDFPMRHIWEIEDSGRTLYVSTTDPLRSNWIRYIRPAETKEERSVAVVIKQGQLHLVTTQNIASGMELTYWADSQSSAWTRKNKIDKTNCGGCNLNFAHPIYYRLHCCIFHDTNYSLTIRKYHCKVCGAAVLGKDNIMKHAAELHEGQGAYQCQYCKKFFLRLNYLEMHRTYGCSQNPQRSRPLCDFCGRKFCQPQKLKVHIKRMHSDMSEVLREFQCKLCLKLLGSRAALQRHMKEVHHKDVVGAATCDRCGKMFQNKSNLKIHMLTHSGVKPFKCKENECKAAFTTKQCLQFHYKKVHGLTEEMMPKIERSVAYTFDAYSGGLVEDVGRGKTPRLSRRNSQQENSNSLPSLDDCSSENSMKVETSISSTHTSMVEFQNGSTTVSRYKTERDSRVPSPSPHPITSISSNLDTPIENVRTDVDTYGTSRLQSKGSKKWMGEFNPTTPDVSTTHLPTPTPTHDVYEFEDSRKESEKKNPVPVTTTATQDLMDSGKLGLSVYRRTESSNASLLVEAALDAAERDIGAVSSPILEDNDRDANLYSISTQLQSPIPQRSPNHLDSYMQQQEELMSPAPTPDNRHSPPGHLHVDYHLHRPVDYMNTPRTHNVEQYLHHEELPRVSSPNNYMHMQQEDLVSPSATPNPSRYQDTHHHHQVTTENLSSDEGDSVAQNLSLSVKEKALQLDLSTSYKYDPLEQDFGRERSNFEPLVLNGGELQGLDMSARGFHHGFGAQVQNARYHHHHLYDITERQSVDLSRTGGYSMSPPPPPPPPPPYPHSDVLRVVSLDLTPGGRHSVDLSLSRSHHLHGTGSRVITSPQSASSSASHVVPDTVEGRILSPPPPPLPGYNTSYPVSPAPYHPPRPGYHHYSGYY